MLFFYNTWRQFYHVKLGRVKKNFINFSCCCIYTTADAPKFYHGKIFLSIGVCPYVVFLQICGWWLFLCYYVFWALCPGFTLLFIMAKKQFFAILDTETTCNDTVADFAIVICDRNGRIYAKCAVLVRNHFDAMDLFYDKTKPIGEMWSRDYASKKQQAYFAMLDSGSRQMASVTAINAWIQKAIGKYNPTLTAYNLAFDKQKCQNTGIDLSGFAESFCLWQAAIGNICKKAYRQFALDNHLFNAPTKHGNMSIKSTAESVFAFLNGAFIAEPHTALEDAQDFELPILVNILKKRNWRDNIIAHNWKQFQVKDFYKAI